MAIILLDQPDKSQPLLWQTKRPMMLVSYSLTQPLASSALWKVKESWSSSMARETLSCKAGYIDQLRGGFLFGLFDFFLFEDMVLDTC
jgi:hypothetical protein